MGVVVGIVGVAVEVVVGIVGIVEVVRLVWAIVGIVLVVPVQPVPVTTALILPVTTRLPKACWRVCSLGTANAASLWSLS